MFGKIQREHTKPPHTPFCILTTIFMDLKIFNTLSGRKEPLLKPKNRSLKLFVCGPTVYEASHLGHARTYIVFDAFVRFLRTQKIKTFYLQNITDIDDKIITRAWHEHTTPPRIAGKYAKDHLQNMKKLRIYSQYPTYL